MAKAALLGFDPWLVISVRDPLEFRLLEAAIGEATILADRDDENMAIRIGNAVGKVLGGRRG
jgi:hypothetical protein